MIFAVGHYAALAVFVIACWGFGQSLLARLAPPQRRDRWLEVAMATTLGLALFILLYQGLALAGLLTRPLVFGSLALGGVAAASQLRGWLREGAAARATMARAPPATQGERYAFVLMLLFALPTLSATLAPPVAFDEVMYHLPWARQVAESGHLGLYDWLRYPWFPYNYDLLYAAALQVYDDVFTHLLHALAGWLSVLMIYRLGVLHANRIVACIGAAIWLALGDFPNSYIDMGVALLVLGGFVALWWWREGYAPASASTATATAPPADRGLRWLALAAFLLGTAAGSKYQALIFLPLASLFVFWRERRVHAWALVIVSFLLPCIYWYGRNWLQTGDPFNPVGGSLFGFTNWNRADYTQQIFDVQQLHKNPPNVMLWPVLFAPFALAARRSPAVRAGVVFCAWSLLVWVLTSRYPRYLMPSFPLLALMAAVGWHQLFLWLRAAWRAKRPARADGAGVPARRWPAGLLFALLLGVSLTHSVRNIRMISPTPESREAFLEARVPGYVVLRHLREHPEPGKLYQVVLNDALYFAPNPVWGDVFGPWRYSDYVYLSAEELAAKLSGGGFSRIVIETRLAPYIHTKPDFERYFQLITEADGVKAYRIRPAAAP